MSKTSYRVLCDSLDAVILIKMFTPEQEQSMFNNLVEKFFKTENHIGQAGYKRTIVKNFVLNFSSLEKSFEEFTFGSDEIIEDLYQSIIELYPPFRIEILCGHLNGLVFHNSLKNSPRLSELANMVNQKRKDKDVLKIYSIKDLFLLKSYLKKNIIGQEEAIEEVIKALKLIVSGMSKRHSLFFIGPSGRGKTLLSKLVGKRYSGNFFKINCAEYSSSHEYAKLIGSPPGYIGHTDKSILAEKADKSNKWVFLFDEVEKADSKFHDFLLSLLDDGTLTDNMGRTLDFTESLFVFTSNIGIVDNKIGTRRIGFDKAIIRYQESKDEILDNIKKKFSPEFMNRIDNFVFFNPLTEDDAIRIASLALNDVPIKKTKSLLEFIVKNSYSEEYGARNINRWVKNNIATVISDYILTKKIPNKGENRYTSKIVDDKIVIMDTILYKPQNKIVEAVSGIEK